MITIHTAHLNLGSNKGTLLNDPHQQLLGMGNLIRHVPINKTSEYRNPKVKALLKRAAAFAISDMEHASRSKGTTVLKMRVQGGRSHCTFA